MEFVNRVEQGYTDMLTQLEEKTGVIAPEQLRGLENKEVRFNNVCEKDADSMRKVCFDMLGIE